MEETDDFKDSTNFGFVYEDLFELLEKLYFKRVIKRTFLDKLLFRKGEVFHELSSIKVNENTLVWYNGDEELGKLFDIWLIKNNNVKEYVTQLLRENKLKRILKNENKTRIRK